MTSKQERLIMHAICDAIGITRRDSLADIVTSAADLKKQNDSVKAELKEEESEAAAIYSQYRNMRVFLRKLLNEGALGTSYMNEANETLAVETDNLEKRYVLKKELDLAEEVIEGIDGRAEHHSERADKAERQLVDLKNKHAALEQHLADFADTISVAVNDFRG